jgi:pimeloyl-ACP methyl ester carboxylesterase
VGEHEVVLLHGQPGSGTDWRQVADRLPSGLRVVALDRPGYGTSRQPAGGFAFNARAVLAELDARGIERAVLVGHSYGGGVALSAARLAPERVEALVLLASVGPGCLTGWDRLLAAPVAGEVCAVTAWWLTPWLARARLAAIAGLRGRPIAADEHVNWHIWGHAHRDHGPLWRTFLTEQRALVRELGDLAATPAGVVHPVLLVADPHDTLVPVSTTHRLAAVLPDARVQLLDRIGHHLPRRGAPQVAAAIVEFLAALDSRPAPA